MATSASAVIDGTLIKTYDVTATADLDTTLAITHGLGTTPDQVMLTPTLGAGVLSEWSADWTTSATVTTLTKNGTGMGSGNTDPQIFCNIQVLHSIIK